MKHLNFPWLTANQRYSVGFIQCSEEKVRITYLGMQQPDWVRRHLDLHRFIEVRLNPDEIEARFQGLRLNMIAIEANDCIYTLSQPYSGRKLSESDWVEILLTTK